MAYSFVPCHQHFENMAEFQSMIDKELENKAHSLREVDSRILLKIEQFKREIGMLNQDRDDIEQSSRHAVANLQYEMNLQERARERVLINERLQDIHEEDIDAEFEDVPEDVPDVSGKKRFKSKPAKTSNKFDRKFVLNVLHSNSKTTDRLPRFIIQQTLHRRTKPKYKNHGL